MSWELNKESLPIAGDVVEKVSFSTMDYFIHFKGNKKWLRVGMHFSDEHPANFHECAKEMGCDINYTGITWEQYDTICEKCKTRDDYEKWSDYIKRIKLTEKIVETGYEIGVDEDLIPMAVCGNCEGDKSFVKKILHLSDTNHCQNAEDMQTALEEINEIFKKIDCRT